MSTYRNYSPDRLQLSNDREQQAKDQKFESELEMVEFEQERSFRGMVDDWLRLPTPRMTRHVTEQ